MVMSLTREQLVDLVNRIMDAEGTEDDDDQLIEILEANVVHPRVLNLIYHPEVEGLREGATAEQIVDAALTYKPIAL
ncbi:hypothetical protein ACF1AY_38800 [Streptomyces sp. NPDC014776]|uniref:hypothetical protein n=1 Tax=unclassified Streptomyces TaxID=2593676 RepID=UPI0037007DB8